MKSKLRMAAMALALTATQLCTGAHAAEPDAYKVGAVLALSGTYAVFGEDMRKGIELAIEHRGGKVLGKPIVVMYEDDETKPQQAVQKSIRLISEGAHMIFGAVSSASTLAVMNVAKQRKMPQLVTMSADDKITVPNGSRYTFRTSNTLSMEQRMALVFAKQQNIKRVYGVTADYSATREGWEWLKKELLNNGIEVIGEDFPPLGNKDYSAIVNKIAQTNADGVALFITGSDTITFIKQAGQVNLKEGRTIFGPVTADETMAAGAGAASLGVQSGVRYHFSVDNPANKAFVEAYRNKYNEFPSSAAGEAYDGMAWWLDVVESTQSWDKEKWIDAFERSKRENSVEGVKTMRACDHQALQDGFWGVVTQGTPPEPNYVMKITGVYKPDDIFTPCNG